MSGLDAKIVVHRGESFTLEVSLAISAGQTVALLGPNGAGKTTAVAALAGLLPLDAGRVELSGTALDDPGEGIFVVPEMRRVGVVFQDYLLFPHLTVVENIAFGTRSRGEGRAESLERASHWIDRLGLGGLEDRKPGALSGGQAQQVALARALAVEPELLLLDEPLAALDITTRARLRRVLAEHLEAFSGPRLLVTHDPSEAFLLGEEICVIEEGAVTQSGPPDDIRMRPRSAYVADLAGANLFAGTAAGGAVELGAHRLYLADQELTGPVLVTVRPSAVALYPDPPLGSPRNTWRTVVTHLETGGERVRVRTGEPLPLTAEITNDASQDLGLVSGAELWVAIKATDIGVEPDHSLPD